jgi:hypothetical protein
LRVRIRWEKPQRAALILSAVLAPASLAAFTAGCWQIAAELRWIPALVTGTGVFSHWQVWLAASAVLLLAVTVLDRFADGGEERNTIET